MHTYAPIDSVLPAAIVQSKKGIGSFVTLDLDGTNPLHLWIYLCDWELHKSGRLLVSSDSIDEEYGKIITDLAGQTVIGVFEKDETITILLSEDSHFLLSNNKGDYDNSDDYFMLYIGDNVVSYSKKDGFYIEKAG